MQNKYLKKYLPKRKKTKVIVLILFILISYIFYRIVFSPKLPPQDQKVVEVVKAKLTDIQQTARLIGIIRSEQATMLISKTPGILDRFVNSGTSVKKGSLIAKIDNKDVERNYKLSQEMEQIAKAQYERFKELHQKGVVSKNDMEAKESIWIDYQKRLSDAKIALDEINIYAPFDGIVGIFKIRKGSQVQPGEPLVNFYDPHTTMVEFEVPISVVKLVNDGAPVFINKKRYVLTHIQKMLDEETHMSPAYVSIQCENCIIGAAVDVDLVVKEKQSAIVIPNESVFLRNGKNYVYVVKKDKAVLIPVQLGIQEKELVEIVSGLAQNDQVIIRGQARLYPNASVRLDDSANKN